MHRDDVVEDAASVVSSTLGERLIDDVSSQVRMDRGVFSVPFRLGVTALLVLVLGALAVLEFLNVLDARRLCVVGHIVTCVCSAVHLCLELIFFLRRIRCCELLDRAFHRFLKFAACVGSAATAIGLCHDQIDVKTVVFQFSLAGVGVFYFIEHLLIRRHAATQRRNADDSTPSVN